MSASILMDRKPPVASPSVVTQRQDSHSQRLAALIHETELKNLLNFFNHVVIPQDQPLLAIGKGENSKARQRRLDSKPCCKDCNKVPYSYQTSDVYRHATAVEFGQRLIKLEYVFCDDCRRVMPMHELRKIKKKKFGERCTLSCPCCRKRIAYVEVLIRKTKMRQALFREEGY